MTDERPRLEVFQARSVLYQPEKQPESFIEGSPSPRAKARLQQIKQRLDGGYMTTLIEGCKSPTAAGEPVDPRHAELLSRLVDSVTSEVGRALVGLTVLQLCVKAITPEQSIRLHKAGGAGSNFSWAEGIPMRVLDKNYITPALRHYNLLKLNSDGFMMTRSLAENYPYSRLYKAAIEPEIAVNRPKRYQLFIKFCAHLQFNVGDVPIYLPTRKIGSLLSVTPITISRYCEWAVTDAYIVKVAESEFHPHSKGKSKAASYSFDLSRFSKVFSQTRRK